MSTEQETIAAVTTPPGVGGVGIVRVSGPKVNEIANAILGTLPQPRSAELHNFSANDGSVIDSGIALRFPAPHSFTGEDVLELQGHGGSVVMDMVLQRVLDLGVRQARAGEFSERAFINGKLDLVQAEAIADLIEAGSIEAARAAQRSLQGDFSRGITQLVEALIELRIYVESAIDFPEEEIDFLGDGVVASKVDAVLVQLTEIERRAEQGHLLQEGMTVVIAGRPNAGKSSLLNQLAGRESAIVTDVEGTTRDVLRENIQLDGMPLHIIDTAGLRESSDVVEQEGIRRAWREIEQADRILLVIDDQLGLTEEDELIVAELAKGPGLTIIRNKIDLSGRTAGFNGSTAHPEIALCASDGSGSDALRDHLKQCMGYRVAGEGGFSARRRHLDALARARLSIETAQHQLANNAAGELMAEDLRQAQNALNEITGEFSSDDLLGKIFSSFCIGK
ncbi:tRNA uridine-5-carboxymethylaminomethyl(34) synthesis GTPase MnmE [Solemya pervernicosa gill symbiont]|uniref:tRNA modification GTPase MnmE n=2 Tax=Gammaproteobacteria incertae sedis TaxID=118884 RepID=A0A1T2L4T5_9GAMM|nr:tRNA uridine-5-carboxymethylaminomethyl(34) synthesis GTPase MnmE [Candidatus Reidiella endopervernicosa]OOZ40084.1 tRNA uridine-5-carboxymethylaminomethyl(34) synthesis GTPase MnmE [Solemya pervernicosa gill symbiont]QKQ25398.1 tRNA uridine-5-carboxymethylaminomethyl(34) synthesis GTPase MnmE [Candidatus Reidiella endopervernicosa]